MNAWKTIPLVDKQVLKKKKVFSFEIITLLCVALMGYFVILPNIAPVFNQTHAKRGDNITGWTPLPPAPQAVFEGQGAVVQNTLYLLGGFNTYDAQGTNQAALYDAEAQAWKAIAPLPEPLTHAGVLTVDDRIYVIGGFVGTHPGPMTDHVWIYDTKTDTWSAGVPLPEPRAAGAAVLLGRQIHYIGGGVRTGETISQDAQDHWVLDIDNGKTWIEKAPLPNPRNHLSGAVLNGAVYIIGGQHLEGEATDNQSSVHKYDAGRDSWTNVASLPYPVSHTTASTITFHNKIFVIGGYTNGHAVVSDIIGYDPEKNQWKKYGKLSNGLHSTVAGVINGTIVITTGRNPQDQLESATWQANLQ